MYPFSVSISASIFSSSLWKVSDCIFLLMKVINVIPICLYIFLNMSTVRQQFQWDLWSWALLHAHSSKPGTQQDISDQWPGQSASYTPLPCRFTSTAIKTTFQCAHLLTSTHTHTSAVVENMSYHVCQITAVFFVPESLLWIFPHISFYMQWRVSLMFEDHYMVQQRVSIRTPVVGGVAPVSPPYLVVTALAFSAHLWLCFGTRGWCLRELDRQTLAPCLSRVHLIPSLTLLTRMLPPKTARTCQAAHHNTDLGLHGTSTVTHPHWQ